MTSLALTDRIAIFMSIDVETGHITVERARGRAWLDANPLGFHGAIDEAVTLAGNP